MATACDGTQDGKKVEHWLDSATGAWVIQSAAPTTVSQASADEAH